MLSWCLTTCSSPGNVSLYRDVPRCNQAYTATGAVVHMTHQVVTRTIAKTEFLLGLASLLIDTIGVEQFQHIHEKVTEIWVALETLRAFRARRKPMPN